MIPSEDATPRRQLLNASLLGAPEIDRVEVWEVTLAPGQSAGRHLHQCPVAGYVLSGRIALQHGTEATQFLDPGDAFWEPADTPIEQFDNISDEPARFIAYYLMGLGQLDPFVML
ncbi:MAG: cupin domain-containing protein [Candidatus Nanopelagicales bacterium]